jgi:hypothetical protein
MIGAVRAKAFSNAYGNISSLINRTSASRYGGMGANVLALQMITASIYSATRDGLTSTVCFYDLSASDVNILRSHGYEVEEEIEDDVKYNVISWENAG